MLDHNLQVNLDEYRFRKVAREAARRGVTLDAVIRDAIDQLPDVGERRRDAIAAILAAESMPVPEDPAELRRELDGARDIPRAWPS
jgi:hypothetical protein